MESVFLKAVNLSINAGWLILAVILLRMIFKKAPRWIFCLLWAVAALRLLIPFSIPSSLSLLPAADPIPDTVFEAQSQIPQQEQQLPPDTQMPELPELSHPELTDPDSADPRQITGFVLSVLWLTGIGCMLLYALVTYLALRHKLATSTPLEGNIRQSDRIRGPFVLGILKPTVYIPYALPEQDRDYVLAHERAHIARGDFLWKPLGFLLLAVYWFHPLVWAGYILFCRDMETACDQRVISRMDREQVRAYSAALLRCSAPGRVNACPLAFGEEGVKGRITRIMHYKKPGFWILLGVIVAGVITAVCLFTVPETPEEPTQEQTEPPTEGPSEPVFDETENNNPEDVTSFIYRENDPWIDDYILSDVSGCVPEGLYVEAFVSAEDIRLYPICRDPVLSEAPTRDVLYYLTADGRIMASDYQGREQRELYRGQMTDGSLTWNGGLLCFAEADTLCVLDPEDNQVTRLCRVPGMRQPSAVSRELYRFYLYGQDGSRQAWLYNRKNGALLPIPEENLQELAQRYLEPLTPSPIPETFDPRDLPGALEFTVPFRYRADIPARWNRITWDCTGCQEGHLYVMDFRENQMYPISPGPVLDYVAFGGGICYLDENHELFFCGYHGQDRKSLGIHPEQKLVNYRGGYLCWAEGSRVVTCQLSSGQLQQYDAGMPLVRVQMESEQQFVGVPEGEAPLSYRKLSAEGITAQCEDPGEYMDLFNVHWENADRVFSDWEPEPLSAYSEAEIESAIAFVRETQGADQVIYDRELSDRLRLACSRQEGLDPDRMIVLVADQGRQVALLRDGETWRAFPLRNME